jgi:hypothetical protein
MFTQRFFQNVCHFVNDINARNDLSLKQEIKIIKESIGLLHTIIKRNFIILIEFNGNFIKICNFNISVSKEEKVIILCPQETSVIICVSV